MSPLVVVLVVVLGAPLPPPKTTCIPEPGSGVLAVSRMSEGPPAIPRPFSARTGQELLLWPRQPLQQWRASYDATFQVTASQAELGAARHFFEPCFGQCYRGPKPP